jgi:hypothetical protein
MRWELIRSTTEHELYHLYDKEKMILSLELNPFSNSARVDCNNEKRVFLIRKEGLRRNKTVIRNEYGIKLGELGHENKVQFIDVNEDRFYFTSKQQPVPEITLYKESADQPILNCTVNQDDEVKFKGNKKLLDAAHPGLLMALCWYMFLPVAKEKSLATV